MDGQRFDELTRRLASGVSRRGVVKGMVAGIAAAAAGIGVLGDAEARKKCRTKYQICRKHGDCCDFNCGPANSKKRRYCGVCPDGSDICGETCCGAGELCIGGACCAAPCGEGEDAACCGAGQQCVDVYNGEFSTPTCCDAGSICEIGDFGTVCCDAGETCLDFGGCCPDEQVCQGRESTTCCDEGSGCTADGCCPSVNICNSAGGTQYCCPGGTCDDNGCTCPSGSCTFDEDCQQPGFICCNGCCVDGNAPDNCGFCGIDCGLYLNDPRYPNCCVAGVCHFYYEQSCQTA